MVRKVPCILVVEDERAIRDLIVAYLRKGGHDQIVTAGNAEEGLFYLYRDRGLDVRLAIVDLVLPNVSGLALIRKLRTAKSPRRRATPVIVLTGRTDADTYKAAVRRGIQGYLMKPISADLLIKTVADVMTSCGLPVPSPAAPVSAENTDKSDLPLPPTLEADSPV